MRVRKPLPIIDARTGKEIQMDKDNQKNLHQNSILPPHYSPPKSKPSSSANSHPRNPLPIINPKTGEIISNTVHQKKGIPIIDPITGTEVDSSPPVTPQKNIIKQPFTVIINRPPPQPKPKTINYSQPITGYQATHQFTILRKQDHPQLYNPYQSSSSIPSAWNKPKVPPEWYEHSTHREPNLSQSHSKISHYIQDLDDEEEESEVDKYEWTGLPFNRFGTSFLDDDESYDSRHMRMKHQLAVW
jgi:hypothetical protein